MRQYKLISLFRCVKWINLGIGCAGFLLLLTACGTDNFSDLNQYIAEVKARPSGPIAPLPDVKILEPFIFKPDDLRDPFKPLEQPEQAQNVGIAIGNGLK
ncbi:MAG: pilus assembly protein PilP, partial [Chitinophagaceae bacterium]